MSATLVLVSPLEGWAAAIEETPDPVFAEKMLGDGVSIDPTLAELHAPCDGEVIAFHAAAHAVTLRAANGAEVLLHVGLETVALAGEGFEAVVAVGGHVAAGDLLLRFDLNAVARGAKSLVSPVVIINSQDFAIEGRVVGREVKLGEPLMTLRRLDEVVIDGAVAAGPELRRRLRVGLAHGIHARPAALLAREAAGFTAEIAVEIDTRRANARSPVAVMALGVRRGDEIELTACGNDAATALAVLADMLEIVEAEPSPEPVTRIMAAPAPPADPPLGSLGGVPAAPGLAIGAAVRLVEAEVAVREIAGSAADELAALGAAQLAVKDSLLRRLTTEADEGREIVQAHLAFLDDPELEQTAHGAIAGGQSAGVAWRGAIGGYVDQLKAAGDPRMLERAGDLADLERQVLLRLAGETTATFSLPDNAIVLADDLLPSQLLDLDRDRIAGLAISRGGPTSHVAILAAAMNIPAVVALGPRVLAIEDGALLILDGDAGRLRIAPKPAEIVDAQTRLADRRSRLAEARAVSHEPARLADGTRIEVFANLASAEEAQVAVAGGAEGCGLLRTEFLFMDRAQAPSEDEQHAAYQAIADALAGRPLVIRTLDVGADKPVAYLPMAAQENPALGLRGVRVSLAWPQLLRDQLRAVLRIRPAGQAQIMLPMIASVSELRAVRAVLTEIAVEFGVAVPPLGVMVETPAAAITADLIAAEADFLSLGTNDLAQYALAMDRTNPELATQVDALHPAVLRLIQAAAAGRARHGRTVAVCGALASDLAAAPILIGLGVTELSAAPAAVPELKAALRRLTLAQCRDLAGRAVNQTSAAEVRALQLEPVAKATKSGALT